MVIESILSILVRNTVNLTGVGHTYVHFRSGQRIPRPSNQCYAVDILLRISTWF